MLLLKQRIVRLLVPLCLAVVAACSGDDKTEDPYITLKEESVFFETVAASKTVAVATNIATWTVSVSDDAKSWLTATKQSNNLRISATENRNPSSRKGIIYIKGGGLTKEIPVNQQGQRPEILVNQDMFTIEAEGGELVIETSSNSPYDLVDFTEDWLSKPTVTVPDPASPLAKKYAFNISWNKTTEERRIELTFKITDDTTEKKVIIVQKGTTGYQGNLDSGIKDDIKVPILSGTATSAQSGSGIEKSFDGDYSSIYHSNWSNGGANYFPITLEYTLGGDQDVDYMIYHPRQSGYNGHFEEVEIWVGTAENPTPVKLMEYDFKGSGSATKIEFNPSLKNVKTVRFVVKSGYGDGQGFVAVSEMEFYRKNPDNFDPLSIFTDVTCSALKPTITEADIDKIASPLYRNIAYFMLKNEYPREFRIQEYKAWPHPDVANAGFKTGSYSLLDNPTGISVDNNSELIVFVGETHGQNISMKIQDLNKPGGDGYGQASYYPLVKGVNKITTRNKGLIYVFYHSKDYVSLPKIKIHFASGNVNGYYDVAKHQPSDWQRLLDAAKYEYFDLVGTDAHLTFPTASYRSITGSKGPELIASYDEMVKSQQDFMGLNKYNRKYVNRAYFHVMYHSYMYATAYRTAYTLETLGNVIHADRFRESPWGPAHELGHIHQTRPGFLWLGMTEVTNNVHSLWIQTSWGNASRIESEDMSGDGFNNRYEKAYFSSFVNNTEHPKEGDVFCKLVSLWQLQLYFAKVKGQTDFYKDFYEKVRTQPNPDRLGAAQVEFVKTVCDVSQTDMTDFFTKWGYLTPYTGSIDDYGVATFNLTQQQVDAAKQYVASKGYPKPTEAVEYISDGNWQVFNGQANVVKGTATRVGNTIEMKNYQNVVAYEVYNEADELIFASNKSRFTLNTGKAPSTIKVYAIAYNTTKTEVTF